MKIFKDKYSLQKELSKQKNISFVPTMGGLHKGHISLIDKTKKYKHKVIVSIFVNPKQFNKKKDFISYPRNLNKDLKLLKKLKIDYLYLPSFRDIYNFKTKNKVFLHESSSKLCGKYRKGHFAGVVNVVNRLLEIIQPKYIFMGRKDYQQLYLIKKHINKRKITSKLIECKTIREKNGLACSTRNLNLNKKQINIASKVYHLLVKTKKQMKKRYRLMLLKELVKKITKLGVDKIEYLESYNLKNLSNKKITNKNFNLFIAFYINNVRLIDNV